MYHICTLTCITSGTEQETVNIKQTCPQRYLTNATLRCHNAKPILKFMSSGARVFEFGWVYIDSIDNLKRI